MLQVAFIVSGYELKMSAQIKVQPRNFLLPDQGLLAPPVKLVNRSRLPVSSAKKFGMVSQSGSCFDADDLVRSVICIEVELAMAICNGIVCPADL